MIITAALATIAIIVLSPSPALAWGPVTHIALGVQLLATVITPDHALQATLLNAPEVFLYGSLAPDIVQGRRLQSRLRRHSHNWSTALELLKSARGPRQQAFCLGYIAHLAGDVVAHNFFLPACFIGGFDGGIASHLYTEARFDTFQDESYRDLLLRLLNLDFPGLNRMLDRAIDSPLVSFRAHRAIFEGGLRRIRELYRVMQALSGPAGSELADVELFSEASRGAIAGAIADPYGAPACRFDPMGAEAVQSALALRRNLQRLMRMGSSARNAARNMADTMAADVRAHLKQSQFGAVR